ncbi:MAG: PAS domain-containing protein [Actinomycetota bacterium]
MAEIERARTAEDLRRDAILEAVAFAAERFLLVADWRQAAEEVLARLGIAAGASRAYVFENITDALGRPGTQLVSEWAAPGVAPQIDDPAFRSTTWVDAGLARWADAMERGESIAGPVRSFPASEWPILEAQNIRSLAAFPVFVGRAWWGLVGLDDCTTDRRWTNNEIDALRAAAGVLGAAVHRRRSEDQLRRADERYRDLVEHIPAVVYVEAPDGNPHDFYISPQVERVFGYSPHTWTWTPGFWRSHVHPDDLDRVTREDDHSNETKADYSVEYRLRTADGRWAWVRDEAAFLAQPDGPGFWQGFLLDITERREAQERLIEAEEKFRTIVEQNQAIFYTQAIDPETGISRTDYIAPGNTDLIGYTAEEVLADPDLWWKIIHPEDRARVLDADRQSNVRAAGEHFSDEYRVQRKDGRIVWVQDEARLVRIGDGPPSWQGFLLEITERKESQERLAEALDREREATRRLRSLDEMKNTFLQAVSHDLRTPLAAILGLAITLERTDVQLEEGVPHDLARRIAVNARKLDRLVTNLLDLDRLGRGIVEPILHTTDVGALVRRALSESDLLAASHVETEIGEVVLPIDGAKVERIIENLLANTARHTPTGTRVWVRVHRVPEGALIIVEDDGPGVSPELREPIFQPFLQGPDAPQHSPGVGIGLALVRRFAELHGGRAWVEDREGGGASFRVLLPFPSDR